MARATVSTIQTAVTDVFNSLKTKVADRQKGFTGVLSLGEVVNALVDAYKPDVSGVVVSGANLAAFVPGALKTALGRSPEVGDIFTVAGTADTTDTALATAKGGAPAAGDLFECTNVTAASEAVAYLGAAVPSFTSVFADDI